MSKSHIKAEFSASVWKEGDWYIAQCLDVDVASQGKTEKKALSNLREALELYFDDPRDKAAPKITRFSVHISKNAS